LLGSVAGRAGSISALGGGSEDERRVSFAGLGSIRNGSSGGGAFGSIRGSGNWKNSAEKAEGLRRQLSTSKVLL
jgi:hypothetical protein